VISTLFPGSPNGDGEALDRAAETAISRRELLDLLPRGLAAALAHQGAMIREIWGDGGHIFLRAGSRQGELFGRYSQDPRDELRFAHELAVRRVIGASGFLRSPAVLDGGTGWLLEVAVKPEPCRGAYAVDTVVAAASALTEVRLPEAPAGLHKPDGWWRASRLLWRSRSVHLRHADVLLSRRLLASSTLPLVTSHGDFRPENVLLEGGAAWVVDWESSGKRPAGYDLMQFWCDLERVVDRDRVFESALELVGLARRLELERLRFAVAVASAACQVLDPPAGVRDPKAEERYRELIEEARVAARLQVRSSRRGPS